MARRLSDRQVGLLDQILADESDPEDSESSADASSSSGNEFQVDSDGNDSDANDPMEAADDGVEDDEQSTETEDGNVDSTSESDDDEILYSLADNAPVSNHLDITLGQLGYGGHDVRSAGHTFLSRSLTETRLSNAPKARPVCIENIIKGQPGPTSYAKQRVSTDDALVDSFFVFFRQRIAYMLEPFLIAPIVKVAKWNTKTGMQ